MKWRTEIQLALVVVGLIVWATGQRLEVTSLQYAGIACFAVATLLRFFKKDAETNDAERNESSPTEPPPH